jgi:hypothetical protein
MVKIFRSGAALVVAFGLLLAPTSAVYGSTTHHAGVTSLSRSARPADDPWCC